MGNRSDDVTLGFTAEAHHLGRETVLGLWENGRFCMCAGDKVTPGGRVPSSASAVCHFY